MIEKIFVLVPMLRELFEGLKVEVLSMKFSDMTAKPGDAGVLISPHLLAYRAKLRISNTSQKHIGIREISMEIAGSSYHLEDGDIPELIKPGEARCVTLSFDCEENVPAKGEFKLRIIDARGRKIISRGRFPVCEG